MTAMTEPPKPPQSFTLSARSRVPGPIMERWQDVDDIVSFEPQINAYVATTAIGVRIVLPYEHWDIIRVTPRTDHE